MPASEALVTSPYPHDKEWSEDNLPDILFYLKPPKSEYHGQRVGLLRDNGKIVKVKVRSQKKPVRDISILPRRISLDVSGWLIEAWRRIDSRITYQDILDRQIEDPKLGLKKLDKNALQNRCRRECRMILGSWTSYERREVPHRTDVEAIEGLSHQNIMLNTILNVCAARQDRLTKVRLTRRSRDGAGKYYKEPFDVNETNLYESTFPIDHFVLKSELATEELHSMDRSMLAAWELTILLQERARIHGVNNWKKLSDVCLPVSWFDRTKNKRVENETFDRGCPVCTWVPGRDQRLHKEWIDEVKSVCSKPANRKVPRTKGSGSGTSKRRKLKNGDSQDVSIDLGDESYKECDCCKEVESWSPLPPSLSEELTPGLTASFPTESEASSGDLTSSGIFVSNNYGNFDEMNKSANIMGLSIFNDTPTYNFSGNSGDQYPTESGPAFDLGAYFDTKDFENRFETAHDLATNQVSSEPMYEGEGSMNEFPTANSYDPEYFYVGGAWEDFATREQLQVDWDLHQDLS